MSFPLIICAEIKKLIPDSLEDFERPFEFDKFDSPNPKSYSPSQSAFGKCFKIFFMVLSILFMKKSFGILNSSSEKIFTSGCENKFSLGKFIFVSTG